MKKIFLLSLVVLLGMVIAPVNDAYSQQAPKVINWQGSLLNEDQEPLDRTVPVTFKIYDRENGGQPLWVEVQDITAVNGYVNVYLGAITPLDLKFNRSYWLEVQVGNGTPYDRTPLTATPYSMHAFIADTAEYAQKVVEDGVNEDAIQDGAVTQDKLDPNVQAIPWGPAGGDLEGDYPNPTLRPGAVVENIGPGDIKQEHLSPSVTTPPSGPAGGDLTGTYPDPLIAVGAVKTDRIFDNAVTREKLADMAVGNNQIDDDAITSDKIMDNTIMVTDLNDADFVDWDKNVHNDVTITTEFDGDVMGTYDDIQIKDDVIMVSNLNAADFADWDKDYNNDLTNTTTFMGDVAGLWNDLQIQPGVITVADLNATEFEDWDKDYNNDLTVTTNFMGDVSGLYDDLQLGEDVVTSVELNETAVAAGTYGSASAIATFDVDEDGRITNANEMALEVDGLTPGNDGEVVVTNGGVSMWQSLMIDPADLDGDAVTSMLQIADGAIGSDEMADGTVIGQVLYWDGTEWVFSADASTPEEGQILKWVFDPVANQSFLQYEDDQMQIPFYYEGDSDDQNMFHLVKDDMGDGIVMELTNNNDAGTAIYAEGGGSDMPTVHVVRNTDNALKNGALYVDTDIQTLESESFAGKFELNIDNDNNYNTHGIAAYNTITSANAAAMHTGANFNVNSDGGSAIGAYATADGANANSNVGVTAVAQNATEENVGIMALANTGTFPGMGGNYTASAVAYNEGGTADDYGVYANATGEGTGIYAESESGSALYATSETDLATEYVATVINTSANENRAMYIEGASENTVGPLDPADADNATLVVRNRLAGTVPMATAIKTYGDIWANSTIGANQLIGIDEVIVGDASGVHVTITPPAAAGDPLDIDDDVAIDGDLDVTGKITSAATVAADADVTVTTKGYVDGAIANAQVNSEPFILYEAKSTGSNLTNEKVLTASDGIVFDASTANLAMETLVPDPTGTYGNGNTIPEVTVDEYGRVTDVSTTTFSTLTTLQEAYDHDNVITTNTADRPLTVVANSPANAAYYGEMHVSSSASPSAVYTASLQETVADGVFFGDAEYVEAFVAGTAPGGNYDYESAAMGGFVYDASDMTLTGGLVGVHVVHNGGLQFNAGIYGYEAQSGANHYAGYFDGDVYVSGDFEVGGTMTGDLTGDVTGNLTGNVTGDLTGDSYGTHNGDVVGGNISGTFTGPITGDTYGTHYGDVVGDVTGDVTGNLTGNVTGNVTGDVTGNLTGDVTGNLTGNVTGDVAGTLVGDSYGTHYGDVVGGTLSATDATITGTLEANLTGNVTGDVAGTLVGDSYGTHYGDVVGGTLSGTFTGPITGDTYGTHYGDVEGNVTGDVTGNLTGNVTGNVTGDVTGNLTGNVTGNVTGDVTGDLTGNVTGGTISGTFTGDGSGINGVTVPFDNVEPGTLGNTGELYFVGANLMPLAPNGTIQANDLQDRAYQIDITAVRSTTDPILDLSNDQGSLMEGVVNGSFGAYGIYLDVTTEFGNGYYVQNTHANAQGNGFMVDYAGIGTAMKVQRGNNTSGNGAVAVYNGTDVAPNAGSQHGANMYLENMTSGSEATALYVERGRTMLAYADATLTGNDADLSGLGYASVINVPDNGVGGTATDVTALPSNAENGQVLYVTFDDADGGTYNAYTVAQGEGLKFVYAGSSWKVIR